MNTAEQRIFLIRYLLAERGQSDAELPTDTDEQKRLLRSLFNIRPPKAASEEFLRIQDEYLKAEIAKKGITDLADLKPVEDGIYLWRGDITTLRCGAVVNAANSKMLGCFVPCHLCIDNAIHTFAGVQLRLECDRLMRRQGHDEPTGSAKLTKAFNLPSEYVLHTVGPIVFGSLSQAHIQKLAACYDSCLELAAKNGITSVAFCCISTGEFHFPNEEAAKIAVNRVRAFRKNNGNIQVIFNVFKQTDLDIYRRILGVDG